MRIRAKTGAESAKRDTMTGAGFGQRNDKTRRRALTPSSATGARIRLGPAARIVGFESRALHEMKNTAEKLFAIEMRLRVAAQRFVAEPSWKTRQQLRRAAVRYAQAAFSIEGIQL